jgi:hypothetical protein
MMGLSPESSARLELARLAVESGRCGYARRRMQLSAPVRPRQFLAAGLEIAVVQTYARYKRARVFSLTCGDDRQADRPMDRELAGTVEPPRNRVVDCCVPTQDPVEGIHARARRPRSLRAGAGVGTACGAHRGLCLGGGGDSGEPLALSTGKM